ncbi:MAG TPA: hypothetical protein VN758_05235 [Solirubrobacterales bacterium]|nr:hypothetical protein [Solirubrobacterales bacterium]
MIGAVLAVVAMLVLASGAVACSCAPQAPAEALRESDAAVVARLVKVLPHGKLHADYRYEVRQVYRGPETIDKGQMLTVRSGRRAAACALPRRLDHVYGLFLARRQDQWFGGICGVIEPRRLRHAAQGQTAGSARASVQPVLCG